MFEAGTLCLLSIKKSDGLHKKNICEFLCQGCPESEKIGVRRKNYNIGTLAELSVIEASQEVIYV